MRTIEVYHHVGPELRFISRMWFLNDKDFQSMAIRLTTGAPFNTLRRDRHEACQVKLIYQNGFESEYFTDGLPGHILNLCTDYALLYGRASKVAQLRAWQFAWHYASREWKHRATLRQMRRVNKLLNG